jgi:23S rRNA (cytosine1962-C5)-methyltransferase
MKTLRLREGKERSLHRGHPWIFDSAIAKGSADAGETVRVESFDGAFLAWAAFSPSSKIKARVWSFDVDQRIDEAFLEGLVQKAVQSRVHFDVQSNGVRLIHAESDGLPGLIVDQYDDTLVLQVLSTGVERYKTVLVKALKKHTGLERVYERSDTQARSLEGLPPSTGWLSHPQGEEKLLLQIKEHQWLLNLDIQNGHKTGFYLDQRESRRRFAEYAYRMAFENVLNCFCYTGGFSVAAAHGMRRAGVLPKAGHVISIDSSANALKTATENMQLNGIAADHFTMLDADVNQSLRVFLQEGRQFDAIVLDPPKFAPSQAHVDRAARAYKDINRLALQLLRPGGVLFTFSCSGGVSADLFHKIVASAGADAHVDGFIAERLQGAMDHPMTLNFPEGDYLKGLVVIRK